MGKNKKKNQVAENIQNQEQNLPAEQDDSIETQIEEESEVNLKKVRRNLLQFIGDGARALGDKAAEFKANHKVADTAIKVGAGALAVGGTALVVASKMLGAKDEVIVDVEEDEIDDTDVETVDETEVEETSDEVETEEDLETETTEEA